MIRAHQRLRCSTLLHTLPDTPRKGAGYVKIRTVSVIGALFLILTMLTACRSGVPQEDYDDLSARLAATESQLADARSEIDALNTRNEDAQRRIDTLEAEATESQSGLTDARALAGQRGSRLMHGVAYMDVAMATLTLGSIDAGTELESVAELSKPLVKLGQENPAYEDLTLRFLRATDPEQAQRVFWTWLFYTLEQTRAALDESEPEDEAEDG